MCEIQWNLRAGWSDGGRRRIPPSYSFSASCGDNLNHLARALFRQKKFTAGGSGGLARISSNVAEAKRSPIFFNIRSRICGSQANNVHLMCNMRSRSLRSSRPFSFETSID
jgi:hypothetical protein